MIGDDLEELEAIINSVKINARGEGETRGRKENKGKRFKQSIRNRAGHGRKIKVTLAGGEVKIK